MPDYLIKGETLDSLANSVRTLSGSVDEMTPNEMINIINSTKSLDINGTSISCSFAPDVNVGNFVTTESGQVAGMSMSRSYIHSSGLNACWLNKDFGLWCDASTPCNIGIIKNNNYNAVFNGPSLALTFVGNKSYTYYPRLFRINDNIAIIVTQRGDKWGNNGCDLALHTLYCDGNTITEKANCTIPGIITHGSSGSSGSYPCFAIVPYNGIYKLIVAAGNPSTSSSDSDYSPSWGISVLTIGLNGEITHYRTTGNNYNSKNCVMYGAAGDEISGYVYAFGYNAYYYVPYGSTAATRVDSTAYNGLLSCTSHGKYLYFTSSTNLYVHQMNNTSITSLASISLGGYGHYIYVDDSGIYVFCYISNNWYVKHYTFNGTAFTLQNTKLLYNSTLTGDVGSNINYNGADSSNITPVIRNLDDPLTFLISGCSNGKPLAAILTDKYYFINATNTALGIRNTQNSVLVIPGLI